jgi:hypothetical protein
MAGLSACSWMSRFSPGAGAASRQLHGSQLAALKSIRPREASFAYVGPYVTANPCVGLATCLMLNLHYLAADAIVNMYQRLGWLG